ncbi:hypothetical protein V2J09_020599 [Rumex salicifolius]
MEDQPQHPTTAASASSSSSSAPAAPPSEPTRSRWTPKPEQIVVLESIFNGGTVNPSKDETVRIRRLLEKFGPVGDANVFYWFQNRRSRSRRRQRQLQAAAAANAAPTTPLQSNTTNTTSSGGGIPFHYNYNNSNNNNNIISMMRGGCQLAPSSSSECLVEFGRNEAVFSVSGMNPDQSSDHNPTFAGPFPHPPNYSSGGGGIITVIVNGVETQIPAGSFDVKAVFGEDVILVHSTGVPVPVDDFGFCFHGLHHGETYFLLSQTL